MYSSDIDKIIREYNYNIPSSLYCKICDSSPQIIHIKCSNYWFEIETNDGYKWSIIVYNDRV